MKETVKTVANLMCLAARTAPKAAGKDFVVTRVVDGEELDRLAQAMVDYGSKSGKKNFDRDGANVAASDACVLVGLKSPQVTGLNCGACGSDKCSGLAGLHEGPEFAGPFCAWRLMDLGIAMGSAVKTASIHNVDNRIMYRAGVAARQAGLIDADVAVGIPLSATGKNMYFDRG